MKCRNTESTQTVSSCAGMRRRERGVALVLTLIMLSVIVIVTVVFLLTTRRNRASISTRIDQTSAEYAAEVAYQHATGKLVERILRDTNLLNFEFFVSRPPGYGFELSNNTLVILRPFESNTIPRVINPTNHYLHNLDTFLDLNRNLAFDDPENPTTRPFGDPIWVGILDRPWTSHLPNNRFVARFAYIVQPVGKSLDLNTAHNATSPQGGYNRVIVPGAGHGYMRNQGVGPWELNLGAFLHELDPGVWDYSYQRVGVLPVALGWSFADARSFVNYRNDWPTNFPPPVAPPKYPSPNVRYSFAQEYPDAAFANYPSGSVDQYADGNLGDPLGADISRPDDDTPSKSLPWPGMETTNHFFHIQELFDRADVGGFGGRSNKVTREFSENLSNATVRLNVAGQPNGALYYKLLAQLGTQTGSDDTRGKIHLNFADQNADLPGTNFHATNFIAWDSSRELAVAFFTNVAERIFLAQSNEFNPQGTNQMTLRSMMEIPVAPTNRYSSAVHRILQMAANIFDATRTNPYPSVFRPIFGSSGRPGDDVTYIVGWENDERVSTLQAWLDNNSNGIPMVVGAKKGLPNFNEFTLRSDILVTRKLQVTRPSTAPGTRPDATNQMYVLSVSNYFGAESWNSYDVTRFGPAPRPLQIVVSNFARASLTNSLGFLTNDTQSALAVTNMPGGWAGGERVPGAFRLTLNTNQTFLSNAVYIFNNNTFANISTNQFETYPNFPLPDWVLTITNRLAYWMVEPGKDRLLDFVLFEDTHVVDLHRDLVAGVDPYAGLGVGGTSLSTLWRTNRTSSTAPTEGIRRQLDISLGNVPTTAAEWREYALATTGRENDKQAAIDSFRLFLGQAPIYGVPFQTNNSRFMQAPFNPAAKLAALSTWQANDPLVHYHPEDLCMGIATNHQFLRPKQPASNVPPATLSYLNTRYSPWNGHPDKATYPESGDTSIKDPGVSQSGDWQFPSNTLATVGLLGRIHRGTPWQSIYFKSEVAPRDAWGLQSPDSVFIPTNGQTISRSHPTNDWRLLDIFTTTLDERTSRGLVSINQTNMETWSALLSGVLVLSNNLKQPIVGDQRTYEEILIQPFGQGDPATNGFFQIWTNIYRYQLAKQARRESLTSLGELLQAVPELTTRSPFLNLLPGDQRKFGLDDFAYEQIPQQIMSLLRVGQPRFVIYAYGQALKPQRIDSSTGLVENYQVTAEFATRTVVRIEGDPRTRVRAVVESFNILPPD